MDDDDLTSLPRSPVKSNASRWSRFAPYLMTAAVLVVAFAAIPHLLGLEGPSSATPVAAERATSRSLPSPELQVLVPGSDATVDPRSLVFRWSEVPGSPYYDVRVVTESGDLVGQHRVAGTEWRPESLDLRPGVGYYVHVEAFRGETRTVSSEHVPFRVLPGP